MKKKFTITLLTVIGALMFLTASSNAGPGIHFGVFVGGPAYYPPPAYYPTYYPTYYQPAYGYYHPGYGYGYYHRSFYGYHHEYRHGHYWH